VTQRRTCSSCHHDGLYQFLDLGLSPVADAYTATADQGSATHPLQVAVCTGCRLVQLLDVLDSELLFGTGYSFYSSASPPLSRYHDVYAQQILTNYGHLTKKLVVEVGCNDGDMLRHFQVSGCTAVGVDPATGPIAVARDRGLANVYPQEFTTDVAREIVETYGRAGVVIANHVLAHVADVADVLHGVATVLADDGVAFVEVQYLPDLLVNNAFDLVYHEHRNFFSLTSLEAAARTQGLRVVDAQLTSRQGGSLRVTLSREAGRYAMSSVRQVRDSEWWLNHGLGAYDGVQGRVERIRARLWDTLQPYVGTFRYLAGYGAPAKATTLLNFCEIDSSVLKYVVDSTPAKQGRFIPGTGVPIISEDYQAEHYGDTPDAYLLLAWNYAHDIISRFASRTRNPRWVIPIPAPVVL
jgi:SAM-dependent methyltransferase